MNFSVRRLVRLSMMAAALCVIAPLRIDIGPVPITLQTLFVALAGAMLGSLDGAICVALYLLLGMCGLPVFAGWAGGVSAFAGATGGFLIAFPALAALTGTRKIWLGLVGLAVVDVVGLLWFMQVTGTALAYALSVAVWPFIIKDVACVVLARFLAALIRKRLPA